MRVCFVSAITSIILLACVSPAPAQERDDNLTALRSAAYAGDPKAQFALGNRFLHGQGVEQDYQQALECFRNAADQSFAPAQNQLAVMYQRGLGVPKDYLGAMNYFRQAANQGYALAQYNLGVMYDTGRGTQIDNQRALDWFKKAASQGQPDAEDAVGFYYQRGLAVLQFFPWALDWYRKAADHGSAQGQNDLGHMFETGLGVRQDYEQALTWYYKAAEQGNPFGQTNIAHMYETGLGLEIDYAQAQMWYRRAAIQGNLFAANNLGWMYEKGEGVDQDYGRALAWYQVAANQGFQTAIENIERVREQLQASDPAQWEAANRSASQAVHEQEERIRRGTNLGWEITELELDARQEDGIAAQVEQSAKGAAVPGATPINAMDGRKFRFEAQKYRAQAARLRQTLTEADEQRTASSWPQTAPSPFGSTPTPVADTAMVPEGQDDPPSRVAQLRYIKGPVSFEPAGTDDWTSPTVNRPMTTGDKLWADRGARAELGTDSAKIRLNQVTGFSFLNLNDHITQIRLTQGSIQIRLRRLDDDESFEVDTPNLALSLLRPGDYRVDVNEDGDTTGVTVRSGAGEVTAAGLALALRARQTATFAGVDEISQDIEPIGDRDDFDDWCQRRDRREEHVQTARYVSPDVIGYEDLDDYGEWRHVPQYGDVWVPTTVPAGWAPYHNGHWAWISPWGWTWVDDAPWGFAPFHYGRWAYVDGTWAWCPGPVATADATVAPRPVYAPALVAWVGSPQLGQSSGGGVAWLPLGPREVYVPPYRVSQTYVTNVNVTNTTVTNTYVTNVYNNNTKITNNVNVSNVSYVNKTAPGAVTAVPQSAFTSAQPVAKTAVQLDAKQVATAKVATNSIALAPQPKSVLGGAAPSVSVPKPPDSTLNRPVVAKVPPPPQPVSFAVQQKIIQANGGRPVSPSEIQRQQVEQHLPPASPAPVKIAPPAVVSGNQTVGNPSQPRENDAKQDQHAEIGRPGNTGPSKPASGAIPPQGAKPATPQNTPIREVPSGSAKAPENAKQPQMTNVTEKSIVKATPQTQGQSGTPQKDDTRRDQPVSARPAVSVSKDQLENKATEGNSPKTPSANNNSGNRPPTSTDPRNQQKPPEPKEAQQKGKQTQQKQKPEGKQQKSDKPAKP